MTWRFPDLWVAMVERTIFDCCSPNNKTRKEARRWLTDNQITERLSLVDILCAIGLDEGPVIDGFERRIPMEGKLSRTDAQRLCDGFRELVALAQQEQSLQAEECFAGKTYH